MYTLKKAKTLLAAAVTGAVALGIHVPCASAEEYVLEDPGVLTMFGDVNFDGAVSLSDAIQLNQYLLARNDELGNWKNADISEDGTLDVFDLIYLRRQLLGEKPPVGGTLNIDIADLMTGELLEGADIEISGLIGMSSFPLGKFHYEPGETISIHGLPTSEKYKYVLDISNLPDNYGNRFGGWDHTLRVGFDEDSDTKDLTIRFLEDDSEFNVTSGCFDWSRGDADIPYSRFTITNKDGDIFYQNIYSTGLALPDGEYHAELGKINYPVEIIDVDGPFAKEITDIYPDVKFEDKSGGIDFTVKDGKADKDVYFDFGPVAGRGNMIGIRCFDAVTNENVEGVEFSIIEAPETYAKVIDKVTSSADEVLIVDGLHHAGEYAYKVKVDKLPEGYTTCEEIMVSTDFVNGCYNDVCFILFPEEENSAISADIRSLTDDSLLNDLGTIVITDPEGNVMAEVAGGEPFVLPDGAYEASVKLNDEAKKDYCLLSSIPLYQFDSSFSSDLADGLGKILFKVNNGYPDNKLALYVAEKNDIAKRFGIDPADIKG